MPLPISDRRISQLYKTLEDNHGKIDQAQALKILAEVSDLSGLSAATAARRMSTMTRDQQLALIKQGMSAGEKADLVKILDQGTVRLDAGAKSFFEAVLGRTTPPPPANNGELKIVGDQSNGLTGFAKPGDRIEAINVSASPTGRLHLEDTAVIATAGADGKFTSAKLTGEQAIKEGDLIRMRARHADGTAGEWVTVRASGVAARDSRNAEVAIFRIGLAENTGKIDVSNINSSRQISEPGAKLQFTNVRTGDKTVVTLNDNGSFADGVKLNGKAGDTFSVAATDGKNNTDYSVSVGKLQVPGADGGTVDIIKDPALHKDELDAQGNPRFSTKRFTGPLFKDGVKFTDPVQGQIGDCYFPSAIAAIAYQNASALQDAIEDNGDGTYTVTFKERDWRNGGRFRDVKVKVDGDLYVRSWGGPLYGSSSGEKGEKSMELWFPILEKAYAQWKGSFDAIGNGGNSDVVMQEILGRDGQSMNVREGNERATFNQIKKSLDAKQPVSAGTYGESEEARYTNSGVYADHSYTVIGTSEGPNGEMKVKLRNPWGESEPAGNGANDGIFELDMKTFSKLYQNLMYTTP